VVEAKYPERNMRRISNSSTWRAILLAWGLSLISLPSALIAGPTVSPSPVAQGDEPFGLPTAAVTTGTLLQKWRDVEREVDGERAVLRVCKENRASCHSQAALQFLAIVDSARTLQGRARLGQINRAINLKIKAMSDVALYGAEDVWSPPLATLAIGAGDCEDYAIAKFVALQEVGVSADDLRIVVLRDDMRQEDHAVVAARLDGSWLMLDNRHMLMVEDRQVQADHPEFVIDHDDVKRYTYAPTTPEPSPERSIGELLH
jgi:predicted transglutaminase-like cysteine proteinase